MGYRIIEFNEGNKQYCNDTGSRSINPLLNVTAKGEENGSVNKIISGNKVHFIEKQQNTQNKKYIIAKEHELVGENKVS